MIRLKNRFLFVWLDIRKFIVKGDCSGRFVMVFIWK